MEQRNMPKLEDLPYFKTAVKRHQKPKPKPTNIIPSLATLCKRAIHACDACRFFKLQHRHSDSLKKLIPYILNPTIVPHPLEPDPFENRAYKFKVMRDVFMIDSARKAKRIDEQDMEIQQLRKRLKIVEDRDEEKDAKIKELQDIINGTTPLTKPRNPKAVDQPESKDEEHQCPKCKKLSKNRQSYLKHIQRCGKTWTCPKCNETIAFSSKDKHKDIYCPKLKKE